MNPLISIIVPVYKVEDYLVRCLNSLIEQSMKQIEIILIDDATPDQCGKICEAYAAKDSRFKVFHHKVNQGLSAARNTGIAASTADYLMFVDSDDWVNEDFCKAAYECAIQNHADLVFFNHKTICTAFFNNMTGSSSERMSCGYITKVEALDLMQGRIGQVVWNKLYRKELFYNVSFPTGYNFEDWGTTYKTVLKANKIYYLNTVLYYYYVHVGSIASLRTEKAVKDRFAMMMQQYHDLVAWGHYPADKLENLLLNIAMFYCIKKKRDMTDCDYVFCDKILRSKNVILSGFLTRRKIMFMLFNHCFPLFEFLCFLWGKKSF